MRLRVLTLVLALIPSVVGSSFISVKAHAGTRDQQALVDNQGRTLTIEQRDTFLNGVAPLDRNRLTREWFHNGKAMYRVQGPGAESFTGTMELGYQVSFPWTLGVTLNFSYASPNIGIWSWGERVDPFDGADDIYTTPFFPGGSISTDLREGPGVQEVATFSAPVTGPDGAISVSNAHGTVTGVAGGVLLRPFAKLITAEGEEVTTYGEIWNMN